MSDGAQVCELVVKRIIEGVAMRLLQDLTKLGMLQMKLTLINLLLIQM